MTPNDDDRAAAHALAESEDLCDWYPAGEEDHSTPCLRIAASLANHAAEARREVTDVVRAKAGYTVGAYTLCKPGIENGFFGWWVAGEEPGFISLPNLIAHVAARRGGHE